MTTAPKRASNNAPMHIHEFYPMFNEWGKFFNAECGMRDCFLIRNFAMRNWMQNSRFIKKGQQSCTTITHYALRINK